MIESYGILFDIFKRFFQFIFNDMMIYTGVSFGWFLVGIFVFYILIKNVLMMPKGAPSVQRTRSMPSKDKGGG